MRDARSPNEGVAVALAAATCGTYAGAVIPPALGYDDRIAVETATGTCDALVGPLRATESNPTAVLVPCVA